DIIKILIRNGVNINKNGRFNLSALSLAALNGDLEIVTILIKNGANINAQDINGKSPLMVAVNRNYEKIAEFLINQGADVNLRDKQDNHTALHHAAFTGNVKIANVLVKNGVNVNAQDINGLSPLMFAVGKNHEETAEFLINQGADVNLCAQDKSTVLHFARKVKIANVLVKNGVKVNAQDIKGLSPLMFAVGKNHEETAEFLINQGADVNLCAQDKTTALHFAENVKIAKI
ncbi:unnamed protein product, partial [Brassicogethes aeneus]